MSHTLPNASSSDPSTKAPQKRKKRRVKSISLGILAFVFLLFSAFSFYMLHQIFMGTFARVEVPAYPLGMTFADVPEYESETVHFASGDALLTGYILGHTNDKGLVVVSHGLGGGAESYLPDMLYFVDAGYRVFAYDGTGSYRSEGEGTLSLAQSAQDLESALDFIDTTASFDGLPRFLYGHSWGGYAVAMATGGTHPIAAAVSIAAYDTPSSIMMQGLKNEAPGLMAALETPYMWLYQTIRFGKAPMQRATHAINARNIPILIIHGTEDDVVDYATNSILSKQEDITNPNAVYRTYDLPGRNGHTSLMLSDDAAQYETETNEARAVIRAEYEGTALQDAINAFQSQVDRVRISQRDPVFMKEAIAFFSQYGE